MSDTSDDPNVIRYDINKTSLLTGDKARWIGVAAGVLWTISLIVHHAPVVAYIFPVLCFVVLVVTTLRGNPIIVDSNRVKMPLRKSLSWSEVEYVENPGRWSGLSRFISRTARRATSVCRCGTWKMSRGSGTCPWAQRHTLRTAERAGAA